MSSSKLRIRIGEVEIDYEGSEEFLKQELPQLLTTAMELHKASGTAPQKSVEHPKALSQSNGAPSLQLTTGSIAATISAKTGSDLLRAAAARLVLIAGKETFSRQELLSEMQSATAYYKASYSGNLSKTLKTALQKGGPLSETAKNTYALTAAARSELELALANA
jgi:hypothetical protein